MYTTADINTYILFIYIYRYIPFITYTSAYLVIIGSKSSLLPVRYRTIDWTNANALAFSSIIRKYHNYIVVITVPANDLATCGARISTGTILSKFRSHIYKIDTWDLSNEDGSVCLLFFTKHALNVWFSSKYSRIDLSNEFHVRVSWYWLSWLDYTESSQIEYHH